MPIHTTYTRKRIDLKLPPDLLESIDNFCESKQITRTKYFEDLARIDQIKRNRYIPKRKIKYYKSIDDILI